MCKLLGVIANKPVDLNFSFFNSSPSFKNLSLKNPDGWGIGWYQNSKPHIFKEAVPLDRSKIAAQKVKETTSGIIISHVRHATDGKPAVENSHPFGYEQFLFAHNGQVQRNVLYKNLGSLKDTIKGETDSEVYFRLLVHLLQKSGDIKICIQKIQEILNDAGSLDSRNFLFSDGDSLYAYREGAPLYYLQRDPSKSQPIEYLSKETDEMLQSKGLQGENAVIVSSEKLTGEEWKPLDDRQLLTVDKDLRVSLRII